jgi:prevent-host-death family protein
MSDMTRPTVSIRELQQNLKRVLARVERGQVIEVTRRSRTIACLSPAGRDVNAEASPWPDLEARTRAVFGEHKVAPGGARIVEEGREE